VKPPSSRPALRVWRGFPPRSDRPLAVTIGNFDGLHRGHQAMLARLVDAARASSLDAAVMTFEPHPREFFSPDDAPARLTTLREKLEGFRAAGVDRVYVCRFDRQFAQIDAEQFIRVLVGERLCTRWLLVGDDFRFGARRGGDYDLLASQADALGYRLHAMPSIMVRGERVSSTMVRNALAAGDLDLAGACLGRPYAISGRVMHGQKLGRTIGFPTANVSLRRARTALQGIFAVQLSGIAPHPLPGVASLGTRPTVTSDGKPTLEVHLFDFDGDLYGRHVTVHFLHKLRDEERYPDLASLTRQIGIDADNARRFFSETLS
jgi:riboflavin kinase / FMN adenylyltransferase